MAAIKTYESRDVRLASLNFLTQLVLKSAGFGTTFFLMNANYVFPRPKLGVSRPRPARAAKWSSSSPPSNLASSRDSNALRASILDTALELGISSNSLVADWMFNNPLTEEPEDAREPIPSPSLTLASSTSEQSARSSSSSWLYTQYPRDGYGVNLNQDVNMLRPLLSRRGDGVAVGLNDVDSQNSDPTERASTVNVIVNDSIIASSHFTRPKSVTSSSVRKLRKKPPGRDGYESASGGYVTEKKATKKEKSGDAMKKKKSFIQVINKFSNDSPSQSYETDDGAVLPSRKSVKVKKKSKTKGPSKEIGYDTDGGYQSENRKSKTRFFKLSTKSSRPDFHVVANGPIPALPNSVEREREPDVPLPIAGRFARTRTFSFSMPSPSPTTTESAETHVDNSFPQIPFRPSPAFNDFTSTTSSPVSAPLSTFDRAHIAPMSDSPSAFNAHLHLRDRDSRFSSTSSSGSGSNQHHKLQNKDFFSPLNSPPSSIQGHQLRPSLSLSSLKHPKPVISFPITRDTSPTSTNPPLSSTRSLHSLSVPPNSSSSVSLLQSKKPFRIKIHHPDLPTQLPSPAQTLSSPSEQGSPHDFLTTTPALPIIQTPRFTKVRPKNPPTDGFGPRSPLNFADSTATDSTLRPSPISSPILSPNFSPLSPNNSHIQGGSKRSSQQTIIPSSDYIVPSPRDSPLKSQYSGLPSPNMTYHIPPPASPAPRGPLPTPPSSCESGESPLAGNSSSGSGGGSSGGSAGHQLPFTAQLRQKMSKMNIQQSLLPSSFQSTTVTTQPVSVGGGYGGDGLGITKTVVVGLRIEKKSGIGSSAKDDDVPKFQKERLEEESNLSRFDNRQSWIAIVGDTSLDDDSLEVEKEKYHQEAEEEDLLEILDRFDRRENGNHHHHHSSSSEHALERSHSFKAGKLIKKKKRNHHRLNSSNNNSFDARPPSQYVPAAIVAPDLYGFEEDDGKSSSVGDRTSRWSESVYSRSSSISIMDEEESEERRSRLLRRVEAMLDAERSRAQETYVPPLPEIPQAYANIVMQHNHHKQDGNNNDNNNAGHLSNSNFTTPGRSWHKF